MDFALLGEILAVVALAACLGDMLHALFTRRKR